MSAPRNSGPNESRVNFITADFGKDRSTAIDIDIERSRVRGRLIMKSINEVQNERVALLHIGVPTKSRFYASRIHV